MKKHNFTRFYIWILIASFIIGVFLIHKNKDRDIEISNEVWNIQLENNYVILENKLNKNLSIDSIYFNGNIIDCCATNINEQTWGKGKRINITLDTNHKIVIDLYTKKPFVYFNDYIINNTNKPKIYNHYTFLSANFNYEAKDSLNTLGTEGLQSITQSAGSFTYFMIANPKNKNAVLLSWLTQFNGIGTFLPHHHDRKITIDANLEFGRLVVQPNSSKHIETFIIGAFNDGREGLELYGDYLAKTYNIKLPSKPNIYSTWYHRDLSGSGASTEILLKNNANFIAKELLPFGLNVIQIDDQWQEVSYPDSLKDLNHIKLGNGPIKTFAESNHNFPSGMKAMANTINKNGLKAGIWFMPFAGDTNNPYFDKEIFAKDSTTNTPFVAKVWSGTCIDPTSPKGEEFLRERFRRIHDWGYRYIKIDGLHTGAPSENLYIHRKYNGEPCYANAYLYNDTLTFVQCFRKGMDILKEEFPNTFITGCSSTQNMSSFASSFGKVHAMRVGPDNDGGTRGEFYGVTAGADFAGNLYFLNNKVWYNDPDAFYVRPTVPLHKAQWMASWQAISGTLNSTSIQYEDLPKERLDIIKRTLPTHSYIARPIDILEKRHPEIWKVSNNRINIIGLFNWNEKGQTIVTCNLCDMGLNANKQYTVFDYWNNKYLGKFNNHFSYKLHPASCAVLAIHEHVDYPYLLSTSRHITQGLIDVISEKWNSNKKQLLIQTNAVANDDYELRLIIPQNYKVKSVKCNEQSLSTTKSILKENDIIRIKYKPSETGIVEWNIYFENDNNEA